eukprot:TRINITY_DN13381_c0_g1_i1.p1 TRINITY_DN13381_c0_g1~~TRINITY_DN13381_c0_g1_i1.p1  ORF type:complete len:603 (-),score=124.45 TRINITY_DN13381_c0_g1_i1:207-2015(-)
MHKGSLPMLQVSAGAPGQQPARTARITRPARMAYEQPAPAEYQLHKPVVPALHLGGMTALADPDGSQKGSQSHRLRPSQTQSTAKLVPRPPATTRQSVSKESSGGGDDGSHHTVPITPAIALKMYGSQLTGFEQSEVLEYPQIFFTGHPASKTRAAPSQTNNNGFDDDRGDYTIVTHDQIAYRYEILMMLGKGSFGQVVKCFDYKTNSLVAVKLIRNKKRFHHQALVEVKILEHIRSQDKERVTNNIHLIEHFYFRNHLCITFELLSINLYEYIKNNQFQGFSLSRIRRFAVQVLQSLCFLAKHRIIHCDLKPENILLKHPNKSAIEVIDFGSSCFDEERMYTYIQSRFYRSPEVILGAPYGVEIDMWSFGCILAELYSGYPLFPGENEAEQLACIMEVLGPPPRHIIDSAPRKKIFFDSSSNPLIKPNSRGKKRLPGTKDLPRALRCSDPLFISFLEESLKWDPRERMTPEEAMRHQWILEGLQPVRPSEQPPPDTARSRRSHHHSSVHHHGMAPSTTTSTGGSGMHVASQSEKFEQMAQAQPPPQTSQSRVPITMPMSARGTATDATSKAMLPPIIMDARAAGRKKDDAPAPPISARYYM